MRIVDLTARLSFSEVDALLAEDEGERSVDKTVQGILQDVLERKDRAVCHYTKQFDDYALTPELMRVPGEHIREYAAGADDELVEILRKAIRNIREFHEKQLEESWEYYAAMVFGSVSGKLQLDARVYTFPEGKPPIRLPC
jgi:histidinol dehydrogenase